MSTQLTLFERIVARDIPADIVYEDERCIAFKDINPIAPTHVLLVPKQVIPKLSDAQLGDQAILGYLMTQVGHVARLCGLEDFRIVVNNGEKAGQTVFHLHIHIIGGRDLTWPPG